MANYYHWVLDIAHVNGFMAHDNMDCQIHGFEINQNKNVEACKK